MEWAGAAGAGWDAEGAVGFEDGSGGDVSGDDLWGVRTMVPTVPPGRYGVRLTVGGRVETTEVVVERNPWIQGVTDEDLVAQYESGVRIRDEVDRVNRAVTEIRRVKGELEERLAASDDEGLRETGERLGVKGVMRGGDIL